jgi:hypothetical protein
MIRLAVQQTRNLNKITLKWMEELQQIWKYDYIPFQYIIIRHTK